MNQEQANTLLRYDPETGELFWRETKKGRKNKAGTVNGAGYVSIMVSGKSYLAHRLVWLMVYGKFPDKHLDHKDRNRANNKLNNLREATPSQNAHNRTNTFASTSEYKGVSWSSSRLKWCAAIKAQGKHINLGRYNTEKEAADAYNAAAKKFFGDFAAEPVVD